MVLFCLFVVAVFSGVVIALVIRVYDLVMAAWFLVCV